MNPVRKLVPILVGTMIVFLFAMVLINKFPSPSFGMVVGVLLCMAALALDKR